MDCHKLVIKERRQSPKVWAIVKGDERREEWTDMYIPMVARPPTFATPNRANGKETVVMFGVTARMTIS